MHSLKTLLLWLLCSVSIAACDASPTRERVVYVPSGNMNVYRQNSGGAQQINPIVQEMYQEDNTRAIVNAIDRKGY